MEGRRNWDGRKAMAGIRMMEHAEVSGDVEEQRALARASARYFWGSLGMDRAETKGQPAPALRVGGKSPR